MLIGTDWNFSWVITLCTVMFVSGFVGMELIESETKIKIKKIELEIERVDCD